MSVTTRALEIEVETGTLDADLALPREPRGIVLFAHGSGSSRRSPRNLYVASRLHLDGFGTLLFDLLTPREQLLEPAVGAVVSRGGRPDLAGDALESVRAPTLLIVGGDDTVILDLNEQALRRLGCVKELAVVTGATHLFEEPGALDDVCDHATAWYERHCSDGRRTNRDTARSQQ